MEAKSAKMTGLCLTKKPKGIPRTKPANIAMIVSKTTTATIGDKPKFIKYEGNI